ncbi:MAG: hypothetical protein PHN88_02720 [Ignavibacteria bacterium]|nr:hypothetical protein [Ignavibacteria bacterium]
MKIYVPSKLIFFEDILQKNGYQKEIKHLDKYLWLISKVATYSIFNKSSKTPSLNNAYLRRIIGTNNTSRIKKILSDLNIVSSPKSWQQNNYSRAYNLNPDYQSRLTSVFINDRISKNIEKWSYFDVIDNNRDINRVIKNYFNPSPSPHPYEDRFFNLFLHFSISFEFLTIEYEEAEKYINDNYRNDENKRIHYLDCVTFIKDKYFFKRTDPKTGRFYSNITNLPRDLRQFLRYKNQKLIEIDIANSQPFLFNLVIEEYLKTAKTSKIIGPHKDGRKWKNRDEYKNITQEGRIYDYFRNEWNKEYSQRKTRDEIKETFFKKIFFCTNRMNYLYPESKLFKKLFPNEYKIIIETKKNDYKYLAYKLQKLEAEMMIYTICNKLIMDNSNIGLFTLHDSILTTQSNIDKVKVTILDEFKKNYGLEPKLKIKEAA